MKFIKRILFVLAFLLLPTMGIINVPSTFSSPLTVYAMDELQDPNGFADLRWGESLSDIQATHKTELKGYYSGSAGYHIWVPDAHGSVYFVGPTCVRGVFIDNKLMSVIIAFSIEDFQARLRGMTKLFGTPEYENGFYSWTGPFSIIMLTKRNNNGMILLAQKGA